MPHHAYILGLGYTGQECARQLCDAGFLVSGTTRSKETQARLCATNIYHTVDLFGSPLPQSPPITHLLSTIAPTSDGDPVLASYSFPAVEWVGYLSATSVYGDTGGAPVAEDTPLHPQSERSRRRVAAEQAWIDTQLPVRLFRLGGIYGPGRSPLDRVRSGRAHRIEKPGQLFNRIHVHDVGRIVVASATQTDVGEAGRVYHCVDNEPASGREVVEYACTLLGHDPLPLVSWEEAQSKLSPMALGFYSESRRVTNARLGELGVELAYPTYREGLDALYKD